MMRLAIEEERTPDDSLPDPAELPFTASETEWLTDLWLQWRALGKPPQISVLMKEITDGYGGIIAAMLKMESLYGKARLQLENRKPKRKKHGTE